MFQRFRATFAASISRDESRTRRRRREVVFFFARFGGSFSEDLDLVDEPARRLRRRRWRRRRLSRRAATPGPSRSEGGIRRRDPLPLLPGVGAPAGLDGRRGRRARRIRRRRRRDESFMSSRWRFPSKRTPPVSEANASAIFALAASDIATRRAGRAPRATRPSVCSDAPTRGGTVRRRRRRRRGCDESGARDGRWAPFRVKIAE